MQNITFKPRTSYIVKGILFLLVAALFEYLMIVGTEKEDARVILIIAGNVMLVLPFLLIGLSNLWNFATDKKCIRKALDTYGQEAIERHVAANTVMTYSYGKERNYFTDRIIVDPKQGVVTYNEIAYMYITDVHSKHSTITTLTICTYDDQTYMVCPKVDTQKVEVYMKFIYEKNPSMIVGYNTENLQKYIDLTRKYKNGEISVEKVSLI